MKALSTLRSVIEKAVIIISLLSTIFMVYPEIVLASQLPTDGQTAQVFEIKVTNPDLLTSNKTENPNITPTSTSVTLTDLAAADPLNADLHQYLVDHNSPLADYTTQLLTKDNWDKVIAISFVESNMCVHNYYFNCSGIGGQEYLRKYKNFGQWIDDMSTLLDSRYNGWSFAKMDGVYVQPYSPNWKLGAESTFTDLATLQQKADSERQVALASQPVSGPLALATFVDSGNQ
jgi:hypothetical protein